MANRFQAAVEHLRDRLQDHASVAITYRRATASVALSATVGSSLLRVTEPRTGSTHTVRTDRDYVFPTADLILSGSATLPVRGDYIDETTSGTTRRYQVLPPGAGENEYRFDDPQRVLLRVHTKYIGTV